jgi:hypothetical protein
MADAAFDPGPLGLNVHEYHFVVCLRDAFAQLRSGTPFTLSYSLTFLLEHLPHIQGMDPSAIQSEEDKEDMHEEMYRAVFLASHTDSMLAASLGVRLFYEADYFNPHTKTTHPGIIHMTEQGFRYMIEINVYADIIGTAASERLRAIVASVPEHEESSPDNSVEESVAKSTKERIEETKKKLNKSVNDLFSKATERQKQSHNNIFASGSDKMAYYQMFYTTKKQIWKALQHTLHCLGVTADKMIQIRALFDAGEKNNCAVALMLLEDAALYVEQHFSTEEGKHDHQEADGTSRATRRKAFIKFHVDAIVLPCMQGIASWSITFPPCDGCRHPCDTLMKCARCKKVAYCSKRCQKAHWKEHQPMCKPK